MNNDLNNFIVMHDIIIQGRLAKMADFGFLITFVTSREWESGKIMYTYNIDRHI